MPTSYSSTADGALQAANSGSGLDDNQSSVEFLAKLHPNAPWALTSILDGTVKTCNDRAEAEGWIAEKNGHWNVYYNHNIIRQGLKGRAKKKDIIAVQAVHVDIDPVEGADIANEQQRLLGMLLGFPIPPSVIVFSGGGYNALWLLKEPWLLDGEESIRRVEAVNRKFERWFGSKDNCSDVSRILRYPGTMNVLSETKRARGRVPAMSAVVKADWDLRYGLEELEGAPALPELAKWWLGPLLISGRRPGKEYPSRSEAVWAAVCELIRSGASDDLVSWLILNEDLTISTHVREQGNPSEYAARQIADARKMVLVGEEFREEGLIWRTLRPRADYRLGDFQAYMPRVSFIYMPNGDFWTSEGVNSTVSSVGLFDSDGKAVVDGGKSVVLPSTEWLKRYRPVAQVTWAPGEGVIIDGRLMNQGGWIEQPNVRIFNQYLPPNVRLGDASKAGRWVELVHALYPDIADILIKCFAQRRQKPQEKINFMVLLIGAQGIGKDTILEPVRRAVGNWNFNVISPNNLTDPFTPWMKSVILNINEAHDDEGGRGGFNIVNRRQVYEKLKSLSAAPPDTLYVNEKHKGQYCVPNVLFPIITSNYPLGAIYLPKDDRRALVGNSPRLKGWRSAEYFVEFRKWLDGGGHSDVVAYLDSLDITGVNFKGEAFKTDAWRTIVSTSLSVASSELGDILELMGWPDVVTAELVRSVFSSKGDLTGDLAELFGSPAKTAKILPYRFGDMDYWKVPNPEREDGRWTIDGSRKVIFAKQGLELDVARKKAKRLADMGYQLAHQVMWDIVNANVAKELSGGR